MGYVLTALRRLGRGGSPVRATTLRTRLRLDQFEGRDHPGSVLELLMTSFDVAAVAELTSQAANPSPDLAAPVQTRLAVAEPLGAELELTTTVQDFRVSVPVEDWEVPTTSHTGGLFADPVTPFASMPIFTRPVSTGFTVTPSTASAQPVPFRMLPSADPAPVLPATEALTAPVFAYPQELLVEFAPEADAATRENLLADVGGQVVSVTVDPDVGISAVVEFPDSMAATRANEILSASPHVTAADPNWSVRGQFVSNDPYYTRTSDNLWGMHGDATTPSNQFGSQAGEAWGRSTNPNIGSKSVYVAVIDEGVDFNHPDLGANVWTNQFDPVDGLDNDGNGFVDDIHGWDFANNDNTVYDGNGTINDSTDNHGTHVAGTIGALGGNGIGVVGVNWDVTIIPVKFLNPSGGSIADAVAAVNYVTDLKVRHGLNIVAINASWGGGGYNASLHGAIIRAANENILFVAAAGNGNFFGVGQNNDRTAVYPANYNTTQAASGQPAASYDSVISVAAIDNTGRLASFSNYGKSTVDIGAPGVNIWSTVPGGYGRFSGTSMAAPHVAGGAALYAADHPGASGSEIREAILDTSVATKSLSRKTVTGGRLNVSSF